MEGGGAIVNGHESFLSQQGKHSKIIMVMVALVNILKQLYRTLQMGEFHAISHISIKLDC